MCGSGTTLRVAKELDRRYVGIDISEEYCKLSQERLKNFVPEPQLELEVS